MAAPRIKAVRLLKNAGVRVTIESTRTGETHKFVRPDGHLTAHEAAILLKTYKHMLMRMFKAGRLAGSRDGAGRLQVPVAECRRLLQIPAPDRIGARA